MNFYSIILGLFTIAGVAMMAWSWRNISKKRSCKTWPSISARVIEAQAASKQYDMQPLVRFTYQVSNKSYEGIVDIPAGESAAPDFAQRFLQKYPLDSELTVFYNPASPQEHTLKAGTNNEDWLLFAVGAGAFVMGLVFILINL